MSVDALFDAGGPREPLQYVPGAAGAAFVPLIGLSADRDDLQVGGLRVVKVHLKAWHMLEKNWLIDLYREFYAARPRYYFVAPVETDMPADAESFLNEASEQAAALVLALRLSRPGFVVHPHHSTPVLRIGSNNLRTVGTERYRSYGLVFGDDLVLAPKERRLGERNVAYGPRVLRSSGPALHLPDGTIPAVESLLARHAEYKSGPPNPAIELAVRNLTRGHDVFCSQREQLLCLVTAVEAVFGGFGGRRSDGPGLGRRIAEAFAIYRGEAGGVEERVERELRPVRNAIAHGSDHRRELDYGLAAELFRDVLRVGLPPLIRLAIPAGSSSLEVAARGGADGPLTPPLAFQRLIARSVDGDGAARAALEGLR